MLSVLNLIYIKLFMDSILGVFFFFSYFLVALIFRREHSSLFHASSDLLFGYLFVFQFLSLLNLIYIKRFKDSILGVFFSLFFGGSFFHQGRNLDLFDGSWLLYSGESIPVNLFVTQARIWKILPDSGKISTKAGIWICLLVHGSYIPERTFQFNLFVTQARI